jgi:hypothetical protein
MGMGMTNCFSSKCGLRLREDIMNIQQHLHFKSGPIHLLWKRGIDNGWKTMIVVTFNDSRDQKKPSANG